MSTIKKTPLYVVEGWVPERLLHLWGCPHVTRRRLLPATPQQERTCRMCKTCADRRDR